MKNILALLADWANGIFALLLAAAITDAELMWWYVPLALLLSHLPDIDALPELVRRGKVAASAEHVSDHRTFLHYPLIAGVVCFGAMWYGGLWGWMIAIVIPLHLINDFYGTGWGLPLFWPLTKTHYKLLGRRVNRLESILKEDEDWRALADDERRLRFLVSWRSDELPAYIARWGMDDWLQRWYLRCNWVSCIEYLLFLLACILLVLFI